jgi:hypothetical protein
VLRLIGMLDAELIGIFALSLWVTLGGVATILQPFRSVRVYRKLREESRFVICCH